MQVFRDILVMPTQALSKSPIRVAGPDRDCLFRGGPIWPWFALQVWARHCRGLVPIPRDRKPRAEGGPGRTVAAGVWCGPVCPHFGHMIADFGMRIAESAHRTDLPLVFSIGPGEEPPPFFHDMLRHLGVQATRVMLIREPTRFDMLHVAPQAERLLGKGPSPAHLDLMDGVVAQHPPVVQDIDLLFVSRSRFVDGRLVAEAYLDEALKRAGATVLHPESLRLAAQLDFYRRARTIVFSEGSAAHSLQLLGRLDADVVVVVRRSGTRLARRQLTPRVRNLAYWDLTTHLIYGRTMGGKRQLNRALSLLDEEGLLARFRGLGLDLARHWEARVYRERRDADIRQWIAYMSHWNLHPSAAETIRRCLAAAKLEIGFDEAWQAASPAR